jgi:CxxC-x17-CxxC domain-containing protein
MPEPINTGPNKEVVFFAKTNFRNADRLFGIKRQDRRQHTYVIGKSGTGKSVLLHNMIVQDISNGEGVAVVDPHGELVEGVLEKIPKERMNDVVYFNPADSEFHVGFNILENPDPRYKHLVASGLMGIFTKIWAGVWSPRMEYILSNCVLALLETPGSTLLGIPRILVDEDFRHEVLSHVTDPVVKAFWVTEYEKWSPQFRNEAIVPIQNKVGAFLSTPMIRNIVGQPKSTINIFDLMNEKKIILVNVSKGRIGEDNSALLGAMLITKIQLAAMERVRIPEEQRSDFYLYVDEFQNFATQSFANILSEARKYRLDLTMANQYIGQLVDEGNATVRDAVFGNVGTMIVFRVGAADAEFLEKEFEPEFTIQDIVNLPNYHIYLKLMVNGVSSRPFSAVTLPPFKVDAADDVKEAVIQHSRNHYALPRETVEEDINKKSGIMESAEEIEEEGKFQAFCSSCGKSTLLPFKPEPGRPVYCKDCLAKIKAGTLRPVKVGAGYLPQSQEKEAAPIPSIKTPGFQDRRTGPSERRAEEPRRDGMIRMEIGAHEPHDSKPVTHLSDLKPREEKPKPFRAPIDVEALRRAISESLKKDIVHHEEPAPHIKPPSVPEEDSG